MFIRELNKDFIASFLKDARLNIRIYSPWISEFGFNLLSEIHKSNPLINTEIHLRFEKEDIALGLTDINSLYNLKRKGYHIKFYQNKYLHAKVYIIDNTKMVFGSCNLTSKAFTENYEIGYVTEYSPDFENSISKWQFDEITQLEINQIKNYVSKIHNLTNQMNQQLKGDEDVIFDYKQLMYKIGIR